MQARPWIALVDGSLRQTALEIVFDVAGRLRDPQLLNDHLSSSSQLRQWSPISISYGNAGVALLYGQLDRCFPGESWGDDAHAHIIAAARFLERSPVLGSYSALFGGLSGFCLATELVSQEGQRYQRLLSTLDRLLAESLTATDDAVDGSPSGVTFSDYDLISGPTGVARYLLTRKHDPTLSALLESLVARLMVLSNQDNGRLGFFIAPDRLTSSHHIAVCSEGCIDVGLAHGVAGPLALMSLAYMNGARLPQMDSAIRNLANWLVDHRLDDCWGVGWPSIVRPESDGGWSALPTRCAWCYGSPGVASALWLAGNAINDSRLRALATEAIQAVSRRPESVLNVPSPIICHGVSGLLQVALRLAHQTNDDVIAEFASHLVGQLVAQFAPDARYGFRGEPRSSQYLDNPGFLEGAAGAALALLAASTDIDPVWDRVLLLS